MCMRMHACVHAHTCTRAHTYTHIRTHTCKYAHACTHTHTHTHSLTHTYMHTHMLTHMHHTHAYLYVYGCVLCCRFFLKFWMYGEAKCSSLLKLFLFFSLLFFFFLGGGGGGSNCLTLERRCVQNEVVLTYAHTCIYFDMYSFMTDIKLWSVSVTTSISPASLPAISGNSHQLDFSWLLWQRHVLNIVLW